MCEWSGVELSNGWLKTKPSWLATILPASPAGASGPSATVVTKDLRNQKTQCSRCSAVAGCLRGGMVVHGGHTWRRPGGLDRFGLGKIGSARYVSQGNSLWAGRWARGLFGVVRNAERKPAYEQTMLHSSATHSASRITSTKLPARPPSHSLSH